MTNTDEHPTKVRILEAAARLFHEQGYNATGIATILREAGANSGSLYHYFPSKDALLVGVLDHYTRVMRRVLMEPIEAAVADPVERVFALMDNYRRMLTMFDYRLGCPIGNLALEVGDDNPDARRLINLNFNNWIDAIRDWLDGAADRFPAHVDRRRLAAFVLTTMEGGIMQARASRTIEPFDTSIAQLRAYIDTLQAAAGYRLPPGIATAPPPTSC